MMVDYRANPPKSLLGSPIVKILDYKTLEEIDTITGERKPIEGIDEKSNVLQWLTEDGTKVSVRPSGTEPKIKFYFGVKAPLCCVEQFEKVEAELDQKIENLKQELNLV
jgi:phosphoglucomutase